MMATPANLERRFQAAFGPMLPLNRRTLSVERADEINRFLSTNAIVLANRRELLSDRLGKTVSRYYGQELAKLGEAFQRSGALDTLADEAWHVYLRAWNPGDTKSETKKRLLHLLDDAHFKDRINALIKKHVQRDNIFADAEKVIQTCLGLFMESGSLFATAILDQAHAVLERKASDDQLTLTADDKLFVEIAMHRDPLLKEAIEARANMFKAPKLTDTAFADIQAIMNEQLFEAVHGGEGARTIARKLAKEFGASLAAAGFDTPEKLHNKVMLWARTEGAVTQNDALMKRGKNAGMDGKIWQSVGDGRVREAHVLNDAAGVIPVGDLFPDGSSDAGSGSVSPFNCRCVCGPAMLKDGLKTEDEIKAELDEMFGPIDEDTPHKKRPPHTPAPVPSNQLNKSVSKAGWPGTDAPSGRVWAINSKTNTWTLVSEGASSGELAARGFYRIDDLVHSAGLPSSLPPLPSELPGFKRVWAWDVQQRKWSEIGNEYLFEGGMRDQMIPLRWLPETLQPKRYTLPAGGAGPLPTKLPSLAPGTASVTDDAARAWLNANGVYDRTELVNALAVQTDMRPDEVKHVLDAWFGGSAAGSRTNLELQEMLARSFNTTLTPWQKEALRALRAEQVVGYEALNKDAAERLFSAMYENTQRSLASAGLSEVEVYRGLYVTQAQADELLKGLTTVDELLSLQQSAAAGWSLNPDIAHQFASGAFADKKAGEKYISIVVQARVPSKRVLSTARTGFGDLAQEELVVIGPSRGAAEAVRLVSTDAVLPTRAAATNASTKLAYTVAHTKGIPANPPMVDGYDWLWDTKLKVWRIGSPTDVGIGDRYVRLSDVVRNSLPEKLPPIPEFIRSAEFLKLTAADPQVLLFDRTLKKWSVMAKSELKPSNTSDLIPIHHIPSDLAVFKDGTLYRVPPPGKVATRTSEVVIPPKPPQPTPKPKPVVDVAGGASRGSGPTTDDLAGVPSFPKLGAPLHHSQVWTYDPKSGTWHRLNKNSAKLARREVWTIDEVMAAKLPSGTLPLPDVPRNSALAWDTLTSKWVVLRKDTFDEVVDSAGGTLLPAKYIPKTRVGTATVSTTKVPPPPTPVVPKPVPVPETKAPKSQTWRDRPPSLSDESLQFAEKVRRSDSLSAWSTELTNKVAAYENEVARLRHLLQRNPDAYGLKQDLDRTQMGLDALRRERDAETKNLLPVRSNKPDYLVADSRWSNPHKAMLRELQDFTAKLDPKLLQTKVKVATSPERRSSYNSAHNALMISADSPVATMVHELGHHIETTNKSVKKAVHNFLKYRTRNDPTERLKDIFPNSNYRETEKAKRDKFPQAYCGKIYPGADPHTEIVSMGFQYMYQNPAQFLREDPEYFRFIYDIMIGAFS